MFPAGPPGIALMLLRFSVASAFCIYADAHWSPLSTLGFVFILIMPSLFLTLGLLTPYCSVICGILETFIVLSRHDIFDIPLFLSILNSAALMMLGPGAYSLDARIFGRRLLNLPSRNSQDLHNEGEGDTPTSLDKAATSDWRIVGSRFPANYGFVDSRSDLSWHQHLR